MPLAILSIMGSLRHINDPTKYPNSKNMMIINDPKKKWKPEDEHPLPSQDDQDEGPIP